MSMRLRFTQSMNSSKRVMRLSGFSLINWRVAENDKLNAQLNALSLSSENLFTANERFDALLNALKAGKQLPDDWLEG